MRQTQRDVTLPWEPPWPPGDTEESVVGSEYHQHVIDAVRDGLRMAAHANGASWHALSQVPLAGFRRLDGSPYPMLPDVFVHPRPNPHPASGENLTFTDVGVPLLAVEVLSETTWRNDLDTRRGKAWSYADAGVAAYLVVDYDRRYMDEHVRALRLAGRRWVRWRSNARGWWEDAALGVSFEFDGPYMRVRDAVGRLMPLPQEANALLTAKDDLLALKDARIQDQAAALERAQARVAALEHVRALVAADDLSALKSFLAAIPPLEPVPPLLVEDNARTEDD